MVEADGVVATNADDSWHFTDSSKNDAAIILEEAARNSILDIFKEVDIILSFYYVGLVTARLKSSSVLCAALLPLDEKLVSQCDSQTQETTVTSLQNAFFEKKISRASGIFGIQNNYFITRACSPEGCQT